MTDKKNMRTECMVLKPSTDIRLTKLSKEQRAAAKEATITLKDFINEEYHFGTKPLEGEDKPTAFRCTIKDIGLHPFEIDIYDARIILVEVTGKTRKDFDGNEVPERLYRGRNYNIGSTLKDIADIMAKRKINALDASVITLRDYSNAYKSFYKYIAGIVSKDYAKALDAMQDNFPFTQLSEGRNDEEDWF